MDADYADDLALFANTHAQAKTILHSLGQAARSIVIYVNSDKAEFMSFKQDGVMSTRNDKTLKILDNFTYLCSNILSTESDVNIHIKKVWTAIGKLLTIRKSNLFDKIDKILRGFS